MVRLRQWRSSRWPAAVGAGLEGRNLNTRDAVRDLYRARWGDPSLEAAFRSSDDQIEVLKWDAATNGLGVDVYATLGASNEDMPGTERGHRVEYFVGLSPGRDAVASALAALGLFARREGDFVGHGHTVPAGGPPWPGAQLSAFLVLAQTGEILPALELANGAHVDFLQAIPLFEPERRWKVAQGVQALMDRWDAAGTPFWDPNRRAQPPV